MTLSGFRHSIVQGGRDIKSKCDALDDDDMVEAIKEAVADKKPIDVIVATKNLCY